MILIDDNYKPFNTLTSASADSLFETLAYMEEEPFDFLSWEGQSEK
jgi:hypothetical protein